MDKIPGIDSKFIESHTDFKALIELLHEAFAEGSIIVPQRHHHDFPNPAEGIDSTMLLMPAWNPSQEAGVKVVTVSPNNSKHELPSIEGLYLYFEAQKGRLQAILDAKSLTTKRTAAASALASTFLSRPDSSTLLVIGTGALSKNLIEAHASVRPIQEVFVYGRNFDKAKTIAGEMQNKAYQITAIDKLEKVISRVDIISCATLAKDPIVLGKYLVAGQHLDMVGAYLKDMREADDEAITKSEVFVDNFIGALKETGDIVIPLEKGIITREDIHADLFELCSGRSKGRMNPYEITFFKSVGHALEDLIAAKYYFNQYSSENL